ncbi:MAG TPA: hypothetical protein VL742_08610 [Casimicrobiaceae bacterium]|nr:hypothetical protein [Casimicrobiaceae bacterium]
MAYLRCCVVAAWAAAVALSGCGKEETPAGAQPRKAPKVVEEMAPPYTYPAPVKGHYKEANVGEFDVVDGLAYPDPNGRGTVVYVTSKPIASPMIAGSACPMTQARALSQLRDLSYLEVTLANGASKYFAAGRSFGGSSREEEVGGRYWQSRVKDEGDHIEGQVVHRQHGSFQFDLPLSKPLVNEASQGEWIQGARWDKTALKPTQQALAAAYRAVHDAAVKKDLKALLAAQGFDLKQVEAIRGLDGIEADLEVYSARFLNAAAPPEFSSKPGTGYVRIEGANGQGRKFANYYHFAPCRGDRLVLVFIAENPQ